jgi:hypothetical protein
MNAKELMIINVGIGIAFFLIMFIYIAYQYLTYVFEMRRCRWLYKFAGFYVHKISINRYGIHLIGWNSHSHRFDRKDLFFIL